MPPRHRTPHSSFPARLALHLVLAAAAAPALAQSRGELLYATHCISCHSQQMHWREKSVVSDWVSLQFQVRRWQGAASLGWDEADVAEVARYLNATIYRFEQTSKPQSLLRITTLASEKGQRP